MTIKGVIIDMESIEFDMYQRCYVSKVICIEFAMYQMCYMYQVCYMYRVCYK